MYSSIFQYSLKVLIFLALFAKYQVAALKCQYKNNVRNCKQDEKHAVSSNCKSKKVFEQTYQDLRGIWQSNLPQYTYNSETPIRPVIYNPEPDEEKKVACVAYFERNSIYSTGNSIKALVVHDCIFDYFPQYKIDQNNVDDISYDQGIIMSGLLYCFTDDCTTRLPAMLDLSTTDSFCVDQYGYADNEPRYCNEDTHNPYYATPPPQNQLPGEYYNYRERRTKGRKRYSYRDDHNGQSRKPIQLLAIVLLNSFITLLTPA